MFFLSENGKHSREKHGGSSLAAKLHAGVPCMFFSLSLFFFPSVERKRDVIRNDVIPRAFNDVTFVRIEPKQQKKYFLGMNAMSLQNYTWYIYFQL